ncbi:IclR family transcriptional regulator [Mesorhizobium sp. B2-3-4]|uniref:IclR family transcriptional regulator n=1 Tax=Mesorhizobium sp. B2-3-4 TaxID=2589959 RepID=UPI001129EAAB|nr:IclR family transcriptional regulator [Mesorhizobium sp. B2-3-4]TPM36130.1 IclR family transcriptional regulator [Mesorhizobium sp. B2-3-4]
MRKRATRDDTELDGEGAQLSSSLVRGLGILRAFRPGDASLGNQDIIARTGLPKATVSRITYTLSALGYLLYDKDLGRYSLGPATVALGYSALSSSAVVHIARPLMQPLADKTGAAVAIGTRDSLNMVYLANCRSESLVTLRLNPGSYLPIWKTSMGLAYAAGLLPDERDGLVRALQEAEPDKAAVIATAIEDAIAQHARLGYVTSFGAWHSYIHAVGVPFRPRDGSPLVAITCGGIGEIITEARAHAEIGPALVAMVEALRDQLEGNTP